MTDNEEQFSLNLTTTPDPDGIDPNRKIFLAKIISENSLGTYETWQIFKYHDQNYLGIRIFYYETDYNYITQVSRLEAIWLINNYPVQEFMNSLK